MDRGRITFGRLSLVDLAGSESLARTNNVGRRMEEGKDINQSLSTLARVVHALASNASHVPYRESELTRVLQGSLGGNCLTTLLVAVSPRPENTAESLASLRFAVSAKKIATRAQQNEVKDLDSLKRELVERQREQAALLARKSLLERRLKVQVLDPTNPVSTYLLCFAIRVQLELNQRAGDSSALAFLVRDLKLQKALAQRELAVRDKWLQLAAPDAFRFCDGDDPDTELVVTKSRALPGPGSPSGGGVGDLDSTRHPAADTHAEIHDRNVADCDKIDDPSATPLTSLHTLASCHDTCRSSDTTNNHTEVEVGEGDTRTRSLSHSESEKGTPARPEMLDPAPCESSVAAAAGPPAPRKASPTGRPWFRQCAQEVGRCGDSTGSEDLP